MTVPSERYRALERTEEFLYSLLDPKKTPRVPKEVRESARSLLKHYPCAYYRDMLTIAVPEHYAKDLIEENPPIY